MKLLGNFLLVTTMMSLVLIAGLQWAMGYWIPFMTVLLVVGGVSLVAGLVVNGRHYWEILRSDAFSFVAKGLGSFSLVAVFLVAVNYLVSQNNLVGDWTPNRVNSLTPISVKILKDLEEPTVFHVFHANSSIGLKEKQVIEEALEIYKRSSPKVEVQIHGIFQDPELAKDFKVGEATAALFATYKGRRKRLQGLLTEKEITGAIIQLSRKQKIVYFTQGHDERRLGAESTYGLSRLQQELERLFYKVKKLEAFPVPADAAFLAIVGPRKEFSQSELQSLETFVEGGGHVLLAVDPGEKHGLDEFMASFGVTVGEGIMASKKKQESQYSVFLESSKYEHELGQILESQRKPLWFLASPLEIIGVSQTGLRALPLLVYEENSVSRKDLSTEAPVLGEGGQVGLVLSEATEDQKNGLSLVVAGDSDFLTNQFVQMNGNYTLALGIFNYLSRDWDIMNLQPKKAKTTHLLLAQTKINFYVLFFILPFPLLFFILAIFLKLRRAF